MFNITSCASREDISTEAHQSKEDLMHQQHQQMSMDWRLLLNSGLHAYLQKNVCFPANSGLKMSKKGFTCKVQHPLKAINERLESDNIGLSGLYLSASHPGQSGSRCRDVSQTPQCSRSHFLAKCHSHESDDFQAAQVEADATTLSRCPPAQLRGHRDPRGNGGSISAAAAGSRA